MEAITHLYQDKNWLATSYHEQGHNLREIAIIAGSSIATIFRQMKKFDIPLRLRGPKTTDKIYHNEQWLRQHYIEDGLSARQIAALVGCAKTTIMAALRQHNIKCRSKSEMMQAAWEHGRYDSPETKQKHSNAIKAAWQRGDFDGEETRRKFREASLGRTMNPGACRKIGRGVKLAHERGAYEDVDQWGASNPNWFGGISFQPYAPEFNKKLKETTRKRDHYICQMCGINQRENQNSYAHDVHHIDYNKQNNARGNLITLCSCCHAKTGRNRQAWMAFFQEPRMEKIQ